MTGPLQALEKPKVAKIMVPTPTVTPDELAKIPYIESSPKDGRTVFLNPFLDSVQGEWKLPIPQNGKITLLKAEPVQMCYYSEQKLGSSDLFLKVIDYTARYYSFNSVLYPLFGLINDFSNCSVIMEKYFVYLERFRQTHNSSIMNFVSADLEFLFGNIRSAYDSLQKIISEVWYTEKRKALPQSFNDVIKNDAKSIASKYDLAESLIDCYLKYKEFFAKCKTIRDGIHHLSLDTRTVFCLEDGFALQKSQFGYDPITKYFDIWPADKTKQNGLVSILALYAYINKTFIEVTESFSECLKDSVARTSIISPKFKLFLRGPYLQHLANCDKYMKEHWVVQ